MKKLYLLSMAILLTGVALARAEDRTGGVPKSQTGQTAISNDYLGVTFATSGLTTADVLVSSGASVFVGLVWSSNTDASDQVTYFDSTSTVAGWNNTNATHAYRIRLSSHSFAAVTAGADVRSGLGGQWKPPAPTLFRRGIVIRASVGTINILTTLFNNLQRER